MRHTSSRIRHYCCRTSPVALPLPSGNMPRWTSPTSSARDASRSGCRRPSWRSGPASASVSSRATKRASNSPSCRPPSPWPTHSTSPSPNSPARSATTSTCPATGGARGRPPRTAVPRIDTHPLDRPPAGRAAPARRRARPRGRQLHLAWRTAPVGQRGPDGLVPVHRGCRPLQGHDVPRPASARRTRLGTLGRHELRRRRGHRMGRHRPHRGTRRTRSSKTSSTRAQP